MRLLTSSSEQREPDRGEHDAAQHQPDGVPPQPRGLLGEGEVAVADRADRLDREVHRVEDGHVRAVGLT
jgi:hypothetical protein